jgi:antitoxin HigA-1
LLRDLKTKKLPPVHPGEILLHDFIEPLGLSQSALAKAVGVTPIRINHIVRGQRSITADTALRLSRYFGTRPGWWLDLQSHYDLQIAADQVEERIARTVSRCPLLPFLKLQPRDSRMDQSHPRSRPHAGATKYVLRTEQGLGAVAGGHRS